MNSNNFRAHFHENFRVAADKKKFGKKTIEDVLRTALWFDSVMIVLNAKSAYEVGKWVYPERFSEGEFDIIEHDVKWNGYRTGKHVPSIKLVDQLEAIAPNTRMIIDHPLWGVLKSTQISKLEIAEYLSQLDVSIRKLITTEPYKIRSFNDRKRVTVQLFDAIERLYNLDSLTALIILFMEALADNSTNDAIKLMTRIYRTCLVLSVSSPYSNFAVELYYLIYCRVFKKLNNNQNSTNYFETAYRSKVMSIRSIYFMFEDLLRIDMWKTKTSNQTFFDFFRGKFGVTNAKKFLPPWVYNGQEIAGNDDLYLMCKYA